MHEYSPIGFRVKVSLDSVYFMPIGKVRVLQFEFFRPDE
jgi:hypothetical protein